MNNKFTRSVDSTLLQNKLDSLSDALKQTVADSSTTTIESQLSTAYKILSEFSSSLASPSFNPVDVSPGDLPEVNRWNENLGNINRDLLILFQELENTELLTVGNFNYFISESNRLNTKIKGVASKLGALILYANNALGNALIFADSFNNLDNIDNNSSLLNADQCQIDQDQGIVTLPIIQTPSSLVKISNTPIINANSNGVAGNNFEIGAARNDNVTTILDNNPDTWFEYERVVLPTRDTNTPLILDITLDMGDEVVVNYVRINPNNFGTKTSVQILDIATSSDGKDFISIKDEVLIPGYLEVDQANIFSLAPSTSKFAGQGIYSFTPRIARFLHIVLEQDTPYTIQTLSGPRSRYAIGIRDVEVNSLQFKTKGELISVPFVATDEINEITLLSTQDPASESTLASITHQVSPDSGNTWYQIRPQGFTGSTIIENIPSVLVFNLGTENSISTSSPVTQLLYKVTFERNTDAFTNNSSSFLNTTVSTTELHQSPATSPFNITLNSPPVENSVTLIDPHFGSRGISLYNYELAIGTLSTQVFQLPWTNIPSDKSKVFNSQYTTVESVPVQVFINGEQWTYGSLTNAAPNAKLFYVDLARGILKFGDGSRGAAPHTGTDIAIRFTPERLYTSPSSSGHIAQLTFPTNGDKLSVSIQRTDSQTSFSEPLQKGINVFHLSNQNLVSSTVKFRPASTSPFLTEVTFVDGVSELTSSGQYSVDYEKGILYSHDNSNSSNESTITYSYLPIVFLDTTDWDFTGNGPLKDSVTVSNKAWATTTITNEVIPNGQKVFDLGHLNIEPGTLTFTGNSAFTNEVPFLDGRTEVLGLIKAKEVIPNGLLNASGLVSFTLQLTPFDTLNHIVSFTNTSVFINEVGPVPSVIGQYNITGNTVSVYLAGAVSNPGSVSYFYQNPTINPAINYSVDYKKGKVYTYTNTNSGVKANYQYSNYVITYPIARVIPSEDYTIDTSNKTVTINDREILRRLHLPGNLATRTSGAGSTYQVLYNYVKNIRPDIEKLEPFFSPVLMDYTIKVLTKSQLT